MLVQEIEPLINQRKLSTFDEDYYSTSQPDIRNAAVVTCQYQNQNSFLAIHKQAFFQTVLRLRGLALNLSSDVNLAVQSSELSAKDMVDVGTQIVLGKNLTI